MILQTYRSHSTHTENTAAFRHTSLTYLISVYRRFYHRDLEVRRYSVVKKGIFRHPLKAREKGR